MSPERWKRVTAIFHAALERDPAARGALLDQACGADPELRAEIDALLAAHRDAGGFGDAPVFVPPEDSPRFAPGHALGPYRIETLIEAGGMGEVYRAHDTRLDRIVAVKVVRTEPGADPSLPPRLEREARLLATISHPHICPIFDVGRHDGVDYLVMEFLDGETLEKRMAKGPLPLELALRHAAEIAGALAMAHGRGIVHRDLKPGNVMLTKAGARVLDFGLAKLRAPEPLAALGAGAPASKPLTRRGTILGTLQYMAPEQLNGEEADARTDIFALGALIHEMVTGGKAFEGKTPASLIAAILEREPAPVSKLRPMSPPALDHLVRTCLAKAPDDRWQSAGDVARQLEWILSEGGVATTAASGGAARRSRTLAAAAVLAAIGLAAATAWMTGRRPSGNPPRVSRLEYHLPEGHEFRNANQPVLTVSPDGTQFAYNTTKGIFVRSLAQADARLVPGTEEDLSGPFFSPDGQWLAYYAGGYLKKIAIQGGTPIPLCEAENPFGAHWGNDGTVVFAERGGVKRVSANGGIPEWLLRTGEGEAAFGPQVLPGGEWLLVTVARGRAYERWDEAEIVAHSLRSADRKILWKGGGDARYLASGHLAFAVKDVLYAVPFDVATMQISGRPAAVAHGIHRPFRPSINPGYASYGVSDGGMLVHVRAVGMRGNRVLALVDRTGVVERLDVTPGPYVNPRLSPDGKRIAVQTLDEDAYWGDIWIHDLQGGHEIRQLSQGANSMWPVWSPDSTRVVYTSDKDGPDCLYTQTADGGPPELVFPCGKGSVFRPDSWSRAAGRLAFRSAVSKDAGIFTLASAPGATPVPFHDLPGSQQYEAEFSPDGKWIAYTSSETGRDEIFLQPFPATGAKTRVTRNGGTFPLWTPDGREIIYRRSFDAQLYRSGGARLYSVTVRTSGGIALGPERMLPIKGFLVFNTFRDYDITGDGQRLLLVYPADVAPGPPRIDVVQNWFEELSARVPVD